MAGARALLTARHVRRGRPNSCAALLGQPRAPSHYGLLSASMPRLAIHHDVPSSRGAYLLTALLHGCGGSVTANERGARHPINAANLGVL